MRRRYAFTWVVLSVGGCHGGQSGDPGFNTGELGGSQVPPEAECSVVTLSPNSEEVTTSQCKRATAIPDPFTETNLSLPEEDSDLWDCDCAGSNVPALADSCGAALLLACGIDVSAPRACDLPPGRCFPENASGSSWDCRCAAGSASAGRQRPGVAAQTCTEAVRLACEETCEDELGSCFGAPSAYTCSCSGRGPTAPGPVSSNAASCAGALAEACGGSCETDAGTCVFEGGVYTCECADSTSSSVAASALGEELFFGSSFCNAALNTSCGEVAYAGNCSSSNGAWSAHCDPQPYVAKLTDPTREVFPFVCTCSHGEPDGGEATPAQIDAPSCAGALTAVCPSAVRSGSDVDGPTSDFGHLCDSDDDCSGNDCYVPGTKKDAVCSKRCETDADCPAFAQCASMFGSKHCFVTCTEDDACRQLNGAIENPLRCMADPVLKLTRDGVCVQESEP